MLDYDREEATIVKYMTANRRNVKVLEGATDELALHTTARRRALHAFIWDLRMISEILVSFA